MASKKAAPIFDPVCGLRLEEGAPTVELTHQKKHHQFCSTWCRDRFAKDPKRYEGTPLIQMRGVTKTFGTGDATTHVLRGVDLNIWEGDFVSLVGASGSGKSTVLNLIGNLDRATDGEVRVRGKEMSALSQDDRAVFRSKTFGFVFQQFNLIPWLTAFENTFLPLAFAGKSRAENKQELTARLAAVGLAHRLEHSPLELSGGEQQRVALARALANNPEILLADEPTGNLDSETGKKILDILRALNEKEGKTLLVVTHDSYVAELADHIIVLKDGRVVRNHQARGKAYIH